MPDAPARAKRAAMPLQVDACANHTHSTAITTTPKAMPSHTWQCRPGEQRYHAIAQGLAA
eukprot:574496-Alexandrium_andersonii.AAC.1